MDRPSATQIEKLRQRSIELAERAKQAQSPEAQKAFEDLAKMYWEIAQSVENLEALRTAAPKS